MKKSLDQLARNLAGGMSRRKAIWTFVSSLGAVAFFTGRKASADRGHDPCGLFCDEQAFIFASLCVQASRACGSGSCAEFTPLTFNMLPNGTLLDSEGFFTCVPARF